MHTTDGNEVQTFKAYDVLKALIDRSTVEIIHIYATVKNPQDDKRFTTRKKAKLATASRILWGNMEATTLEENIAELKFSEIFYTFYTITIFFGEL